MRLPWFPAWLKRHLARHELIGLPDPLDNFELYEGWASEFERLRITEERAEDASRKLTSRSQTKANHFHKLMGIVFDKPPPNVSAAPHKGDGPDYSRPETLTREQRLERIALIRRELPAIELSAATFPEQAYHIAAAAGREELTKLVEVENACRSQATRRQQRPVAPPPY